MNKLFLKLGLKGALLALLFVHPHCFGMDGREWYYFSNYYQIEDDEWQNLSNYAVCARQHEFIKEVQSSPFSNFEITLIEKLAQLREESHDQQDAEGFSPEDEAFKLPVCRVRRKPRPALKKQQTGNKRKRSS